jgi:HEAT repeat protein
MTADNMWRNPWRFIFTAGLGLALAACNSSPEHSAARDVARLLEQNDVRAMTTHLERALRQWPDSVELRRQRVLLLLKTEQVKPAIEALRTLPASDPVLTTALQSRDPVIRASAAQLIAEQPSAVASRVLVNALEDSVATVRRYSARELGRRAEPGSLRALFRILKDESWQVRAEAVIGLARLGNPHAAGWMLFLMGDSDAFVRYQAEQALFILVAESNRHILQQAMERFPVSQRLALAAALAKLNDPDALELLRRSSAVESAAVRERTAELIGRAHVLAATNDLARLLSDPDPGVQTQAKRAWNLLKTNAQPSPEFPNPTP